MIVLLMFAQLILEDASRVWTYLSTGSSETDMHLGFAGSLSDNVVDCQMSAFEPDAHTKLGSQGTSYKLTPRLDSDQGRHPCQETNDMPHPLQTKKL